MGSSPVERCPHWILCFFSILLQMWFSGYLEQVYFYLNLLNLNINLFSHDRESLCVWQRNSVMHRGRIEQMPPLRFAINAWYFAKVTAFLNEMYH